MWERKLRRNREGGAAGGVPPPQRASPARPAAFGSAKGSAPAPEPDKPPLRRVPTPGTRERQNPYPKTAAPCTRAGDTGEKQKNTPARFLWRRAFEAVYVLQQRQIPKKYHRIGEHEQGAVEPVQQTPMAGKQAAVVLDPHPALDLRKKPDPPAAPAEKPYNRKATACSHIPAGGARPAAESLPATGAP